MLEAIKAGLFGWAIYLVLAIGFGIVGMVASGLGGEGPPPERSPAPTPEEIRTQPLGDVVDRMLEAQAERAQPSPAPRPERESATRPTKRPARRSVSLPARLHVYALLVELGFVALASAAAADASPKRPLAGAGVTGGLVILTGLAFAGWIHFYAPAWIGIVTLPAWYLPLGAAAVLAVALGMGAHARHRRHAEHAPKGAQDSADRT